MLGLIHHSVTRPAPQTISKENTVNRGSKRTLMTTLLAGGLAAGLTLATPAQAAVLVQYDFGPDTSNGTFAATTVASDVSAASVTASDVNISFTTGTSGAALSISQTAATPTTAPGQEANAIAANRYAQFSLSPDAGFTLDLANLTFDVRGGGTSDSRGYAIYVSTDGFVTSTRLGGEQTPSTTYTPKDFSIGLTGIASTATFRIYHWTTQTNPNTGRDIRFDNITVNGAVIPEPASLALLGLGGLLMLGRSRRG